LACLPHLLRISCDSLVAGKVIQKPGPDDISGNQWPPVSVSEYNEDDQIKDPIKSLLALAYPRGRREILIISDSSSDRADEIVRSYEDQGIGLLGLEGRGRKKRAANTAAAHLTGEIAVNTDTSIRITKDALKPLIVVFQDKRIGCASALIRTGLPPSAGVPVA